MKTHILILITLLFYSCSDIVSIKNTKKEQMKPVKELKQVNTKSFLLDANTAPKPLYIQMINDSLGNRQLSFLNNYNNSIYIYYYETPEFIKKITFDKNGPNAVRKPIGFHIKNQDSIYIYRDFSFEVLLANSKGNVLNKIYLTGGADPRKSSLWTNTYPTYYVKTVVPFIETPKALLLTGLFENDINDSIINKLKFTAHIDFRFDKIDFTHTYPPSLHGGDIIWGGGLFSEVFPQLHPDGKKIIYSFPVSHDLYIADIYGNTYKKVYAGSNFAGTIMSLPKKHIRSKEKVRSNFVRQDMYAAILYDKFRKVYYRYLRKAIPNAPLNQSWKEKEIAVIIMDKDFNYLGETVLGTEREWHWQNSFVTKEGLNIEYLDNSDIDEANLTLKIFSPENI